MTRIKFCGLTRPEDAAFAERIGAAFLGAILASGPRLVSPARAQTILGARRPGIQRVGVFGHQTSEDIVRQADIIDLDIIQLHGDPPVEQVQALQQITSRAIWPVIRVSGTTLPPETTELAACAGGVVLDAKTVGQLGGTGVALDWSGLRDSVAELRTSQPHLQIVLAGGLRPHNIAEALGLLLPDVVDVSSGVEIAPGIKDHDAMSRFVTAVRTATQEVR